MADMTEFFAKIGRRAMRERLELRGTVNNLRHLNKIQRRVIADLENELERHRRRNSAWSEIRRIAFEHQIPQERVLEVIRAECSRISQEERGKRKNP